MSDFRQQGVLGSGTIEEVGVQLPANLVDSFLMKGTKNSHIA